VNTLPETIQEYFAIWPKSHNSPVKKTKLIKNKTKSQKIVA